MSGPVGSRQDGEGVLRRLAPSTDPVDQATVLGWIAGGDLSGIVSVQSSVLNRDRVEVREESFQGFALGEALAAVHENVTTVVALGLIRDAAQALAQVHALDGARPPIHGRLTVHDLFVTDGGEVRVGGLSGLRGDPQTDVRALLGILRDLLRPKADKPGGAALLERLSSLHFESAEGLYQTIDAHLQKQPTSKLRAARRRFTDRVLENLGGAQVRPAAGGHAEADAGPHPERSVLATEPAGLGYRPEGSASPERSLFATDASAFGRPSRADAASPMPGPFGLPVEEPEGSEAATVQTDPAAQAALQAALQDALDDEDKLLGEPFFDPEATEAVKNRSGKARSSPARGSSGRFRTHPADALRGADLEGMAGAHAAPPESPFDRASGLPPPRPPTRPSRGPPPPPDSGPKTGGSAADHAAMAAARDALMAPAAAQNADRSAAVLVGDYRVVAAIGKGGMGEIYLARSTESDRLVALKVLGAAESGDDEALGMLMDEAAIMARIEHPHVLRVVDFGRAHGRYFLATEYLEGRPLVRVMIESYDRDGGMDHVTVACVGAQAARGLHAAHTATTATGAPLKVVHRDVSPQNIFLTYSGEAKVIDFGVARATERISRTQIGLVKGKAAYMSPEQAEGRALDARSDVFSLGVCLWEMVAGKRLFKQPLDYDTLVAVQTAPIEAPTVVRGQPEPELDRIILAALSREPGHRTLSAERLAEQLEGYAREQGARDARVRIREVMDRLFHEEAEKERELVVQLEARAATDEEVASLRELSGVSHRGSGREITLVAEPDALGALDRYGAGRNEITGDRILSAVKRLDAERRSGEYPPDVAARILAGRVGTTASHAPAPDRSWGSGPSGASSAPRRRWLWVSLAMLLAAAALVVLLARLEVPPTGPALQMSDGLQVEAVSRQALAEALRSAGARIEPASGPVQRVEGLGSVPLMLDEQSRLQSVRAGPADGWLLELTPVDGGPAVVWVARGRTNDLARGLSVNDCPARARVDAAGIEIRYGAGSARLPHGGGRLTDVLLDAPEGATRLEIQPLGVAFGASREDSPLTRCPSGWEAEQKIVVRRLPVGRYTLQWSGPGLSAPTTSTLDVTRTGVEGGELLEK